MRKFPLKLHPAKTRLLEFGPFAARTTGYNKGMESAALYVVGETSALSRCAACGTEFWPARAGQKFCMTRCRLKVWARTHRRIWFVREGEKACG